MYLMMSYGKKNSFKNRFDVICMYHKRSLFFESINFAKHGAECLLISVEEWIPNKNNM